MISRRHESYRIPLCGGGAIQVSFAPLTAAADFAVVFVHGFGSTRGGEKAQALELSCARRGWAFAAFDFRGHGQSTGTMLDLSGGLLLEDLQALADDLQRKGIHRLCLVGSSMGGWVASWFALRHPGLVPACVLIAPALDFIRRRWAQLTEEERDAWKKSGRLRVENQWVDTEIGYQIVEEIDQFPVEQLAAEWSTPLLIYHGLQDETIPFVETLDFVQRTAYADVELRVFKNGDHRLSSWKAEMAEGACDFFDKHLGRGGRNSSE